MVSWIASFSDTYEALTSVWPVIYTATAWWATCTGNYGGFAGKDPLWISVIVDRVLNGAKLPAAAPGALRAIQFFCPERLGAQAQQIKRRAMSSPERRSQMKPQLPWATLASTAAAIPMPASTAIGGGAKRPDDLHGRGLKAGCHQPEMTSVTVLRDGPAATRAGRFFGHIACK